MGLLSVSQEIKLEFVKQGSVRLRLPVTSKSLSKRVDQMRKRTNRGHGTRINISEDPVVDGRETEPVSCKGSLRREGREGDSRNLEKRWKIEGVECRDGGCTYRDRPRHQRRSRLRSTQPYSCLRSSHVVVFYEDEVHTRVFRNQ